METKYYKTYEDDFVTNKNQNYKIKKNYKWINNNVLYKIISFLLYIPFSIISIIYTKCILKVKFVNKKILKNKKNYFLYANHTQVKGDAFNPVTAILPVKPYIIVNKANLGIKILGKLLPYLGALPIPDDIHQMQEFIKSINKLSKTNPIIIYPEAHVWPYCTFIREFKQTSFEFPVINNIPSYTMTTTYQKGKRKPKITIYFDGPFYPDNLETKKEKIKSLHSKVYNSMVKNSKNSTYNYITYKKKN